MFVHAALFQWYDHVTPQQIEEAQKEIRALQGQIPGLLQTSVGANLSPRHQGYTHGIVMFFQDKKSLDAYTPHPIHQKILGFLKPLLKQAAELDYEIEPGAIRLQD